MPRISSRSGRVTLAYTPMQAVGSMTRSCSVCHKKISNLSSHMKRVHGLGIKDFLRSTTKNSNNAKLSKTRTIQTTEYTCLLQQFACLSLSAKRKYILVDAPHSFIELLRDCVCKVINGTIQCDDYGSVSKLLRLRYCCKRLPHTSNNETRKLLGQNAMVCIIWKIFPSVLQGVQSLSN